MVERVRYTVSVNGIDRPILSVTLDASGDLRLDFKSAPLYRRDGRSVKIDGIIRYIQTSVHPSNDSPTGNLITRKRILKSGDEPKVTQWTEALKSTNRFASIVFSRYSDLSHEVTQDEFFEARNVSLGELDVRNFNLFTGIFVSNSDRKFDTRRLGGDDNFPVSIVDSVVGDYRITILYMYLNSPSIPHGTHLFYWTTKSENVTDAKQLAEIELIKKGMDEGAITQHFAQIAHDLQVNFHFDLQPPGSVQPWGRWSRVGTLER